MAGKAGRTQTRDWKVQKKVLPQGSGPGLEVEGTGPGLLSAPGLRPSFVKQGDRPDDPQCPPRALAMNPCQIPTPTHNEGLLICYEMATSKAQALFSRSLLL